MSILVETYEGYFYPGDKDQFKPLYFEYWCRFCEFCQFLDELHFFSEQSSITQLQSTMQSGSCSNSNDSATFIDDFSDTSYDNQRYSDGQFPSEMSSWRVPLKSKSEPQLNFLLRQETFSVSSEPIKRTSQNLKTAGSHLRRSVSNAEVSKKADDFDSNYSIVDHCHSASVDPVVVFWGKSDKSQNIDSNVIVKFILEAGDVFTHAFSKTSKVSEIRDILTDIFKVPSGIVQLKHEIDILKDDMCVSDFTIERFGCITLQLSSLEPDRYPLDLHNVYPDIPTNNDVLTVVVNQGMRTKEVIVEIENRVVSKPFLGGYRHKVTGLEYHHAVTQTAPRASKNNNLSRNTQTFGLNKLVNTPKNKITQTSECSLERQGRYGDRVLVGDPERRKRKAVKESSDYQDKIVLIQRNLRSWLVRKMMLKMKEEYKKCIEWENCEKYKIEKENEERTKMKENAMKNPKSRGDFEHLYHNLEEWRNGEAERINKIESIAARKSEQFNFLETEIKIINSIEKFRVQRKKEIQKEQQEQFLEKTATPLRWAGSDGRVISMDSLGTQRAKEMRQLYLSLRKPDACPEERIATIHMVKQAVQKFDNSLVPELVSLLDRERHILVRNLKQANLPALRERTEYLFLEFVKDPSVNPEAAKFLPRGVCQRRPTYKCISCQTILPYHKFSLHTKADDYRRCTNCSWLRNIGGPRIDVNPVRHIMNAVRREELHQSHYTSVALIMQEQDFYHLIVNIWLGHSAIGGSGNLEELRLGRWDFTQYWSPWNCILLSVEELKAHLRFSNPEQIYSLSFVKKIKQRHQIGRIHFSKLAAYSVKKTSDNIRVIKMIDNFNASKVYLDRQK